jgi:hypothetical protein
MNCNTCDDRRTITIAEGACQPEHQAPCPLCVGITVANGEGKPAPDYEPAWREMYDSLSWMHGCKALSGYAGWPLGKIATDLIDQAYPDLRAEAGSLPKVSSAALEYIREVQPVRITDDHGNPGLLYTQQNMVDAFKAGRNGRG